MNLPHPYFPQRKQKHEKLYALIRLYLRDREKIEIFLAADLILFAILFVTWKQNNFIYTETKADSLKHYNDLIVS